MKTVIVGRAVAILYALLLVALCALSLRWHQVRECADVRHFDIGDQTLGAKGTWCARWLP